MQIRLAVVLYNIQGSFKKGSIVYTVVCVVLFGNYSIGLLKDEMYTRLLFLLQKVLIS